MIQQERLVRLFCELVSIDSPSLGERQMCDRLTAKLRALGMAPEEDGAAARIGGTAGNLYACLPGDSALEPILLSAHMDTVSPACGKRAVVAPDGTVTSDGTTVLGADDLSGVTAILEALTALTESGRPHRPVEILFSAAEETYCTGIRQFDFPRLRSKEVYVFDLAGPVGTAARQAPTILSFRAVFSGRAAHAAFSPEDGIHAVRAAADAVSHIPCGRVGETTVNIGTIAGGEADNIVPAHCAVTGEVRSFSDRLAREQLCRIGAVCAEAAGRFGASVQFSEQALCTAYCVEPDLPAARRFRSACRALGLAPEIGVTYGGSDNNHFVAHGLSGLVVASGMNCCHSSAEYTTVSELTKAAELALALILSEE